MDTEMTSAGIVDTVSVQYPEMLCVTLDTIDVDGPITTAP